MNICKICKGPMPDWKQGKTQTCSEVCASKNRSNAIKAALARKMVIKPIVLEPIDVFLRLPV